METNREPDVYVKTVLTFGDKPAPAMAQIALRKTAKEAENCYPDAAKVITDNTYVDDICDSVHTVDEAKRLTKETDKVLESGGFHVKGWLSNKSLENTVANNTSEELPAMKLLQGEAEEKVLGVVWNHEQDVFMFKVHPPNEIKLTKRTILSHIARIYDPIGSFLDTCKNRNAEIVVRRTGLGRRITSNQPSFMGELFQRNERAQPCDV